MIGILQYLAASPLILGSMLMAVSDTRPAVIKYDPSDRPAILMSLVQSVPTADAASLSHSPRNNHNHLARRLQKNGLQNRSNDHGNEVRAVRPDAKRRVKKRAPGGGKTCRIRQAGAQGLSSSAVAASTTAVASAQETATDVQSTDAQSSTVESSTQAAPQETAQASSTWVEASSSAPAAEPTAATSSVWVQPAAPSSAAPAAGNGGWMNSGSKVGLCWPNGDWVSLSSSSSSKRDMGRPKR